MPFNQQERACEPDPTLTRRARRPLWARGSQLAVRALDRWRWFDSELGLQTFEDNAEEFTVGFAMRAEQAENGKNTTNSVR